MCNQLVKMTVLLLGVLLLSTLGLGIEGDPAPGRSPGPPKLHLTNNNHEMLKSDSPEPSHPLTNNARLDGRLYEPESSSLEDQLQLRQDLKSSTVESLLSTSTSYSEATSLSSEAVTWSGCGLTGSVTPEVDGLQWLNMSVQHELFKTDVLVKDVLYSVIIINHQSDNNNNNNNNSPATVLEFSVSSLIDGEMAGEFHTIGNTHSTQHDSLAAYTAGFSGDGVDCQHTYEGRVQGSDWVGDVRQEGGGGVGAPGATSLELRWRFTDMNTVEENGSNVTFVLRYRRPQQEKYYEKYIIIPATQDCQLYLIRSTTSVASDNLPSTSTDCRIWFPRHNSGHGLVIDLYRLNVPCGKGHLQFIGHLNTTNQHQTVRSRKQAHLCGKLEELPDSDRHIYFPSSNSDTSSPCLYIHGRPVFTFQYRLVDYCYNVTFNGRNGTFTLNPGGELQCTFKIYLPYGNRVELVLQLGDTTSTSLPMSGTTALDDSKQECRGLYTEFMDGDNKWSHCTRAGDPERRIEVVSRSNRVVLRVTVRRADVGTSGLGLKMSYKAQQVEDIVGLCGFGWVAMRQFCVTAVEGARLPWAQAEMECVLRGGHLASVRNEHAQDVMDALLINSPGNKDHNAYWIGASDKTHEGDFHWTDGLPFSYTNWFPGWSQHDDYNKQPNDDGLSEQDCVEVRRTYALPSSTSSVANNYMWNDRDCSTPNYFICERLQNNEPLEENWPPDCNRTVLLSRQQPRAAVSSPGFPRLYPDNANCETHISAPPGYRIVLDFEELVLEDEPSCSYDYLEIIEKEVIINPPVKSRRRHCGDWSSKLKLLRHVSHGSKISLRFSSDYSHHYGGFKARVSMESATECSDDRLQMFNHSCYLFVSYPEVTWPTALQICRGIRAKLASILSPDEERFITTNIRKMSEYRTSARYWLGAKSDKSGKYSWLDDNDMSYFGWLPGHQPLESPREGHMCLGIQWMPSSNPVMPSGLYWRSQKCEQVGGYVCKRQVFIPETGINFNRIINGTEGKIATPNHPGNYYNNLDFSVKIVGPERSRIVIQFDKIDMEPQLECLYDFVKVKSTGKFNSDEMTLCGIHDTDMDRFNFVSQGHEVEIFFHSDYSVNGAGFSLSWNSVDVSGCPLHISTAKEDVIISPNYPNFLLAKLDCTFTISAPLGKRIWLEFEHYDIEDDLVNDEAIVEITLGKNVQKVRPFRAFDLLSDGTFLSESDRLTIQLRTNDRPKGGGFKATYRTINTLVQEEHTVMLTNTSFGAILHLNYPSQLAANVDFMQHLVAPLGWIISLELFHVQLSEVECNQHNVIEIYDNYADENGTSWHLCQEEPEDIDNIVPQQPIAITSFLNTLYIRQKNGPIPGISLNATLRVHHDLNHRMKVLKHRSETVESCNPNPCLNGGKCLNNGNQKICQCPKYHTGIFCTLTQCDLEPCLFGTCELTNTSYRCHCNSGYMGVTCAQKRRPCEGNPCESRGICIERADSYICQCHAWWKGPRCQDRMVHIPYKPLSERMLREPFWLGLMTVSVVMGVIGLFWCAKRHFPEKIEKLLAEEDDRNRISSLRSASVREQLAASGGGGTLSAATSVQLTPGSAGGGGAPSNPGTSGPGGAQGPNTPRSLFGRLGIRKPSLLSLTSPHAAAHAGNCSPGCYAYSPATARTFSLDDLLKPAPRRTPSPKKKRNNSTPTKKNAAEKKQILQQLIGPSGKQSSRKVSLGELMLMTDRRKDSSGKTLTDETRFSCESAIAAAAVSSAQITLSDPKLEKKVTFARLLSKVSQEMSSGSDLELGIMQANRLSCAFARASNSTPPSPSGGSQAHHHHHNHNHHRTSSPNSTSSIQGSDSLTSCSDLPALSSSVSDLMHHQQLQQHHRHLRRTSAGVGSTSPNAASNLRQKPSSADSILAMFRNFSSSSAGVNLSSSLRVSPSTTPTASTPQDDLVGDDETSTSSIRTTPISFESPLHYYSQPPSPQQPNSIEVSVMDTLSAAHKSQQSNANNFLHPPTILLEIPSTINKCLSPIRELPTPLPSPSVTPYMRRCAATAQSTAHSSMEDVDMISDDRISIELSTNISLSDGEMDDEMHPKQDIVIDPQGEDGLILEEAAAMHSGGISIAVPQVHVTRQSPTRPVTLGHGFQPYLMPIPVITVIDDSSPIKSTAPPPLVIPVFTIQTPSPIHQRPVLGSPPPRSPPDSCHFQYPIISTTSGARPRRLIKDYDKPTSLDLPYAPPMITITCNLSEVESDIDSISPNKKTTGNGTGSGMSYLSPFSMVTRGEHMASESNLSSSGYSSMASPGPSRCGSSNPLCSSETEDHPGPSGHHPNLSRRPSPLLKSNSTASNTNENQQRGRSDSETLSDDPLLESNDEGIGTDHLEEKIDDGELKSAKELEIYICTDTVKPELSTCTVEVEQPPTVERLIPPPIAATTKNSLQLPSIIVHSDSNLSKLSPMSSRSESPLSDRTIGLARFSPQFYGRHKDMPFTDSDGLYDFPSSDKVNVHVPRKASRKREKKSVVISQRNAKTPSPTKTHSSSSVYHHLDIPSKIGAPRKLSPKRRSRLTQQVASSSSSSSESVVSAREFRLSSSSPSPDTTIRWSASLEWPDAKKSPEASDEDTADEVHSVHLSILPAKAVEQEFPKNKKINKLRAISHQIRFLRRLELSLKRRDRVDLTSLHDNDEDDSPPGSPRCTSPLLQPLCNRSSSTRSGTTPEMMRKSHSSGRLQSTTLSSSPVLSGMSATKARRGRLLNRSGEYLPCDGEGSPVAGRKTWGKRVVITGAGTTGHSD